MIVVDVFAHGPHVEGLVDDQHAQPVAGRQQSPGGGIVGAAQGVVACFLHLTYPALLRLIEGRAAQGAQVVVDAAALQLHGNPIEPEPANGIHLHRAQAGFHLRFIDQLATLQQDRLHLIQLRVVHAPGPWMLHRQPQKARLLLLGGQHNPLFRHSGRGSVRGDQFHPHPRPGVAGATVLYRDLHPYHRQMGIQRFRHRENAPGPNGHIGQQQQIHMPVQPRTRIPAAVGHGGIVHGNGDLVYLAKARVPGQVREKRRVSVGVLGHRVAVDGHFAIAIRPVQFQQRLTGLFGQRNFLPINQRGPGKKSVAPCAGRVRASLLMNRPVVRQIHPFRGQVPASRLRHGPAHIQICANQNNVSSPADASRARNDCS